MHSCALVILRWMSTYTNSFPSGGSIVKWKRNNLSLHWNKPIWLNISFRQFSELALVTVTNVKWPCDNRSKLNKKIGRAFLSFVYEQNLYFVFWNSLCYSKNALKLSKKQFNLNLFFYNFEANQYTNTNLAIFGVERVKSFHKWLKNFKFMKMWGQSDNSCLTSSYKPIICWNTNKWNVWMLGFTFKFSIKFKTFYPHSTWK